MKQNINITRIKQVDDIKMFIKDWVILEYFAWKSSFLSKESLGPPLIAINITNDNAVPLDISFKSISITLKNLIHLSSFLLNVI